MDIYTSSIVQAKAPIKILIILLHGYGADGANLIDVGQMWGRKFPAIECIAPNAPFLCEQGMGYQWASLRNYNFDQMAHDIQQLFPVLKKYIDQELEKRDLTYKNLILMGFSQGAHLALHTSVMLAEKGLYCAGVMRYAGWMVLKKNSFNHSADFPPVLLVHGSSDTVVPLSGSLEAEKFFKKNNVSVTLYTYKNLGHSINIEGLQQGEAFIQHILSNIKS